MDPFVGEIRLMPYSYAPNGWALCQGQLLAIRQYTALFSLLGVQYGGDGRTTFGLPDLRGRTYVGIGQGAGLTSYQQGAVVGTESVTLLPAQLPAHAHTVTTTMPVSSAGSSNTNPIGQYFAPTPNGQGQYSPDPQAGAYMAPDVLTGATSPVGDGQAHENRMPLLVLEYCIALTGVFPQRQ